MKKINLLVFALATVFMFSCNEEAPAVVEAPEPETTVIVVKETATEAPETTTEAADAINQATDNAVNVLEGTKKVKDAAEELAK